MLRRSLRFLFRQTLAIYFRRIEVVGEIPNAKTGGRLFAANHVNALVDPILVLTQARCEISPVAKSTLWKIPGLRWLLDAARAVPVVRRRDDPTKTQEDNDAVFARVAGHLAHGGNILIFPEGTSHNEPHLLALRSGAGRMLAQSHVLEPNAELSFQAVALEFDARDIFRSRALVLFGPVRSVRDFATKDDSAGAITEKIRADLGELLVEAPTWDDRLFLVRVAEMFANDSADLSLEGQNRVGKRLTQARRVLETTDAATVRDLEVRLRGYFRAVDDADVDDALVARASRTDAIAPAHAGRRALRFVTLPLGLVGMILYALPYRLPRFVTKRIGGDPDVASTYKIGVGLLVHPLWASALVAAACATLHGAALIAAMVIVFTSPFAALPWLDRLDRIGGRFRFVGSNRRRVAVAALATQRTTLMNDLESARQRAEP